MAGREQYYTVWLSKNDELVASGTSGECTQQLGFVNRNTFFCTVKNVRAGKNKKYVIVQEDLYGKDDEHE